MAIPRADVQKAEQGVGIAAARLAQRLNLDPVGPAPPRGGPMVPIDLIALDTPPEELIQVALRQRPDLAGRPPRSARPRSASKQEIGRPLLPTLWLGFSGGAFGGGSNLAPPLLGNFGGRTDFDVRLYWTFLAGAGNLALIKSDRRRSARPSPTGPGPSTGPARGDGGPGRRQGGPQPDRRSPAASCSPRTTGFHEDLSAAARTSAGRSR